MNSEKYVNYYIEGLTSMLTDAMLKNVSLQVSVKIGNESLEEQSRLIDNLKNELQNSLGGAEETIATLNQRLAQLESKETEFDNVRHQVQHVDTFRNELIREREEHQKTRESYEKQILKLRERIEYLQLTPAKRKKVDEVKSNSTPILVSTVSNNTVTNTDTTTKDGGSF